MPLVAAGGVAADEDRSRGFPSAGDVERSLDALEGVLADEERAGDRDRAGECDLELWDPERESHLTEVSVGSVGVAATYRPELPSYCHVLL